MFLHIDFANGSNPYVYYGNKDKIKLEIRKWKQTYDLYDIKTDTHGLYVTAKEKRNEKEDNSINHGADIIPLF